MSAEAGDVSMSPMSQVITLVSLTVSHHITMYQLSDGLAARLRCSRGCPFRVTDAREDERLDWRLRRMDTEAGWGGRRGLV